MNWMNIYYNLEFFFELLAAQLLFILHFKRRKFFIFRFLAVNTISVLILYFTPYLDFGTNVNMIIESVKFTVVFFLFMVQVFFSFEVTLNDAIFITVYAYAIQHIAYSISEIIRSIIRTNPEARRFLNSNEWIEIIKNTAVCLILYIWTYFFIARKLRKENEYRVERLRQTVLSLVILATTIILNLLEVRLLKGLPYLVRIMTRVYAIVCCIFAMLIQYGLFEKNKLKQKNEILDQLLRAEAKHHQMSKENIELINIKCHDLKKQIGRLRQFTDEKAKAESIAEIESAVMFYDSLAKTGNESLDIVLTEKSLLCEKNRIRLSYIANGDKLNFMNSVDIYSLFSNALDNAIESVLKINDRDKRVISLKIKTMEKLVKINIENYYEGELFFENGLPLTKNKDKELHGYGIKSMKYITEKYNGNFMIAAEKQLFSVQILLPVSETSLAS